MGIRKEIPNIITLTNLGCGLLSIYWAFEGNLLWSALAILSGAFFDFFDGLAARLLDVASPMGKELDSLADVVTFGVAPGFMMFHYPMMPEHLKWVAFIIPLLSAYRLARFNVDDRQSSVFMGLPVPANALLFVGLVFYQSGFAYDWNPVLPLFYDHPIFVLSVVILGSMALVSEIPLLAFKFSKKQPVTNKIRLVVIVVFGLLLLFFNLAGLTIIVLLYLLYGLLNKLNGKHDLQS